MCRVYSTILMIGTRDKTDALKELPVRLLLMDTAKETLSCLKTEHIDSVVSRWDLVDMPSGMLLKRILGAKPGIPTIAFIDPGNQQQEIAARSIGVTVILSDDIDAAYFRSTIRQFLHIDGVASLNLAEKVQSLFGQASLLTS